MFLFLEISNAMYTMVLGLEVSCFVGVWESDLYIKQ